MAYRFAVAVAAMQVAACGASSAEVAPAAPAPVAAAPADDAPCFDGPPLVASTVYADLWRYAASVGAWDGESPMPSTTYGSCSVADAVIRTAGGAEVAHLGCGISFDRRGLVDHLGLQVGASGALLVARTPKGAERLVCVGSDDETECWFTPEDNAEHPMAHYTVTGAPMHEKLTGAEAVAFVSSRTIARIHVTMYCH